MKAIHRPNRETCISILLVLCIFLLLFISKGYAPFGPRSLATNDANVQYLDLFLYYRDVLEGRNSISYTFSKLLGGTNIALLSYYLSSPLSLLVVFFQRDQMISFYHLITVLKILLATAAFSVFLRGRFPRSGTEGCRAPELERICRVLLPACYGLSLYVLSQIRNVMWLDGVYMLPLILLGVYRVVRGDRLWKLSVPVALSVLFNWYTAGMNCLFSAGWFVLEVALQAAEEGRFRWKGFLCSCFRYAAAMMIGLMCSAVLFLPSVSALAGSTKGNLKLWHLIRDRSIRAPILSVIETSVYGATDTSVRVSLYCGALPVVGAVSLFTKKERFLQRLILAALLLVALLMFFWAPLNEAFNLLANPTSFWVRFSYLQVFAVLFVAAWVFLTGEGPGRWGLLAGSVVYAGLLAAVHMHFYEQSDRQVYLTAAALLVLSALLFCVLSFPAGGRKQKVFACLSVLVAAADLGYQTLCITEILHNNSVLETAAYIRGQEEQIRSIREYDPSLYRISQTVTRNMGKDRITANFDEPLAYGYWSISHYSSTVDDRQLFFLDRVGYKNLGYMMAVTGTSVLGADSLLGVKYLLSDTPVSGWVEGDAAFSFGEKKLYENPYVLPMAFRCADGRVESDSRNHFEYQNALYSSLLGREIALYRPLKYEKTAQEGVQHYRLFLPDWNCAVYGNLEHVQTEGEPVIDLNGRQTILYSRWLAPTVFYVPTEPGEREAYASLKGSVLLNEESTEFYALDLDLLGQVTRELREQSRGIDADIKNGHIVVRAETDEGAAPSRLLLTVPHDRGWRVLYNGAAVGPELWAGLFYSFPLTPGETVIEMTYHVPLLKEGLIVSAAGVLILCLLSLPRRRAGSRHDRGTEDYRGD